jgi:2-polyprenyl-3-methyl-5-hydroxy-6-metoxy-1,4-benzoquinol methylase
MVTIYQCAQQTPTIKSQEKRTKGCRMNTFKLFYRMAVGLLSRLHAYEERTCKYLNRFKHYADGARIVVDVGCGTGAFSKALASNRHLVIALDIESRLLREFKGSYIEKVCADAQQLPLRDGSVDAVLSLTSRASWKPG